VDDPLKYVVIKWANQPADFYQFIRDFGSKEHMQFYLALDGVLTNQLPFDTYCKACLSTNVSYRRRHTPEDSGYACDECGSMDIE